MAIVRVALDLPLPQLFDYVADDASAADIGRRVEVPFAGRSLSGVIVAVDSTSELTPDRLKPVRHIVRDVPPLPREWLELAEFCSRYYHHPLGETLAMALPPALRQARAAPVIAPPAWYRVTDAGLQARPELPTRSLAGRLIDRLAGHGPATRRELRTVSPRAPGLVEELVARGWLEQTQPMSDRQATPGPPLLAEQTGALAAVTAALGSFTTVLLHGVTGSGKTEVYLGALAAVLARGGQALMLVPEIGLTPQLEARVGARFPGACVVSLHSGLGERTRARGFHQAMTGAADIVLGTRLAVFTPLPRLGLIVVDEEHDPSYKQQDGIRYSARDVAIYRAKQRAVPVLLGSATPSLESYHHGRTGRYRLLELPRRAVAQALPEVRFIDTRRETLQEGMSEALLAALAQRLTRAEQALVFLNRRGYAPVLACPACGWVSGCRGCSAHMVLHLADRRLRCHHCGAEDAIPRACPTCGNQDIRPFGRGTQRIEAALLARFPQARILRIDRDSAGSPKKWNALLQQVERGEADILVGTQMLAKGHDFPRLTLVGVLGADASLFAADFRAPERLFAQLMQVGGRSGRAALAGEVLIQTEYPEHPLYQCLAAHDYAGFAATQLDERQAAGFPPFTFQAILRAEAPALAQAIEFLQRAAALAAPHAGGAVNIYDAVPMRLTRRASLERAQLLVESPRRLALQGFLQHWIAALYALKAPRELRWHIDVDPLEF
jgi:primosomal protein N' (replication factor Y)